ncbi:MAG: SPOR domain-containing protein [Bacteroidetes bacterium]|nr:SPOR domain-containing protein [Bacteroidota bacterium]
MGLALALLFISVFSYSQRNKPYREDLSGLRPRIDQPLSYSVEKDTSVKKNAYSSPTKTVNAKVDAVLDSIDVFNLTRKFIDGYTIQVYSGQKREDAMNTKKKIQDELPDLVSNLQYQQPKFRVTVGKYFSKLEAQKDLLALKGKFATAILVPEKIMIR